MKSFSTPKPQLAPQTTLFLKPSFKLTVLASQMSVQVTAQPLHVSQPNRR